MNIPLPRNGARDRHSPRAPVAWPRGTAACRALPRRRCARPFRSAAACMHHCVSAHACIIASLVSSAGCMHGSAGQVRGTARSRSAAARDRRSRSVRGQLFSRSRVPAVRDRDVARGSDGSARPFRGSEWLRLGPAPSFYGRGIFSQFFPIHVYKRKTLKKKVYIQFLFLHLHIW